MRILFSLLGVEKDPKLEAPKKTLTGSSGTSASPFAAGSGALRALFPRAPRRPMAYVLKTYPATCTKPYT